MTMPQGSTEEPTVAFTEEQAVAVHVVSSSAKPGKHLACEFARFRTVIVSNVVGATSTTPGAQRILNRSLRRNEARIFVLATVAAQAVTDGVLIGSRDEINSGNPATIGTGGMGGYVPIGKDFPYKGQGELWVAFPAANAAPVYVTVLDMQYASDPDSWKEES